VEMDHSLTGISNTNLQTDWFQEWLHNYYTIHPSRTTRQLG